MDKLKISWNKKQKIVVQYGIPLNKVLNQFEQWKKENNKIALFKLNEKLISINDRIEQDGDLIPVYFSSPEGIKAYEKTLNFLLIITWQKLYPEKILEIGQALNDGIYFSLKNKKIITEKQFNTIKKELTNLIKANSEIKPIKLPYAEALQYFQDKKKIATLELLNFRNESIINLVKCDNIMKLATAPLLSHSGKINSYKLQKYSAGILLRHPQNIEKKNYKPYNENKNLFQIHSEYRNWSHIMGVSCVGDLNKKIESENLKEIIQVNEILHDNKIADIANKINQKKSKVKIVLIAGPSSSGKTTFTKKLATHLKVHGFNPAIIGMDNYFLPKEKTPLDTEGHYDFESIRAIDIKLLNSQLKALLGGEKIKIPIFDFIKGKRKEKGTPIQLQKNGIIIMEGIHGLNKDLTPEIPKNQKFLIYVSALTQLQLDKENRISTTDNRLLRRIVRDAQFRGMKAEDTIEMWSRVRRGEEQNIFPFQANADIAFNSALNYEISVLKVYAAPLLKTIKPNTPFYSIAVQLQELLKNFSSIPSYVVPKHSILREFIGGSSFHY